MLIPIYEQQNLDSALERLGYEDYGCYLRSSHWNATRRRLLRIECELCGFKGRLSLHHMTYSSLGAESDQDTCTLCHRCHRTVHRAALRRGGSLYVKPVLQGRRKEKVGITALEVSCPLCGALPTHHCRLPSGEVRVPEHKERRRKLDARNKESKQRRRARAKQSQAKSLRVSVDQLDRISAAREAEFPLEALRRNTTPAPEH